MVDTIIPLWYLPYSKLTEIYILGCDALKCVFNNPLEGKKYDKTCDPGTTQCGSYTCTFLGQSKGQFSYLHK